MAAPSWPKFVVLRSIQNNNYLRYAGGGFLKFNGEDVTSPRCKFALEKAKTVEGLFNIRCCYSDTYWAVAAASSDQLVGIGSAVKAGASEPNEDLQGFACTLFELKFVEDVVGGETVIEIVFPSGGWSTGFSSTSDGVLGISAAADGGYTKYAITDWETAVDIADIGWPKYMVLRSNYNGKYLRYMDDEDGFLKFDGDDAMSPYCKFELERSETVNGAFNIRSCYNNKYWMFDKGVEGGMVRAIAAEPNEVSGDSCTLFFPRRNSTGDADVLIQYAGRYRGVCLGGKWDLCLGNSDYRIWYTIFDWESLLVLPDTFALKGYNGKYLGTVKSNNVLEFSYTDRGNANVAIESVKAAGGSAIYLKSKGVGLFWERFGPSNPVTAQLKNPESGTERKSQFQAIKIGINTIALRSLHDNSICRYNDGIYLQADYSSITKAAIFTVEELVHSREIYNVRFRLEDARIYNENIIAMVTTDATNGTTQPSSVDLTMKFTKTTSSTWDHGIALRLGVSTTMTAGVPFIVSGSVTVETEFRGSYSWGEARQESKEEWATRTVNVPPMTIVRLSALATKGTCQVPFSYTQRDVLYNGQAVISEKDDGIYTGINSYNLHFDTTQEEFKQPV